MIERDDRFPPFDELMAELAQLRAIAQHTTEEQALSPRSAIDLRDTSCLA